MRASSLLSVLLPLSLLACTAGVEQSEATPRGANQPKRIVSLDYCADQYVLQFSDREAILALSIDAEKRFSYLRDEAEGFRKVRPRAADVLALKPDLIVRSYGGGPNLTTFLERAGVPVVQIGFPQSIEDVRAEVVRIGSRLGEAERARAVVKDMDRRLKALAGRTNGNPQALYMTPGGVTAGEDTIIHELMGAAGLANFQQDVGWHPIPLERLAYERPELIIAAFFESENEDLRNWSATRHPVAKAQLEEQPVAAIDGAWTACGGWFLIEAIETIARTAESNS